MMLAVSSTLLASVKSAKLVRKKQVDRSQPSDRILESPRNSIVTSSMMLHNIPAYADSQPV